MSVMIKINQLKRVPIILGNPGVIHSVPIAFITDECSGYGMDHALVTEDGSL